MPLLHVPSARLDQLAQEGAVQLFREPDGGSATLFLGAVGQLQFDVLIHRLAGEYRVEPRLTPMPYTLARWVTGELDAEQFRYSQTSKLVEDRDGRPVLLFKTQWNLDRLVEKHPELELQETAAALS